MSPNPHDILLPYQYFKLLVTTEMLQIMVFNTVYNV